MNEKRFEVLNKEIRAEIPTMTNEQLHAVEIWGEYSKIEQDKRFPELWEWERRMKQQKE